MSLDIAGLQGDVCNVEAWIHCHLNGIKHRGVELPLAPPRGSHQGSMDRVFLRYPKTFSRTGASYPYEVPSRLVDYRFENRRRDLFQRRPVVAYRLAQRIQIISQDAPLAQEYGIQLHACELLGTLGA